MARSKKVENETLPVVENEQREGNVNKETTVDSIKYEGYVTVSVKRDGKIYDRRTFKNSGTSKLFTFIGKCLQGKYSEADSWRPFRIKLWNNTQSTPPSGSPSISDMQERSSFITYDTAPEITVDSSSVTTTLHFMIPYSYIKLAGTNTSINQVCLYGSASDVDFDAYYYLTSGGSWDPITVTDTTNYLLIVEQKLRVSN